MKRRTFLTLAGGGVVVAAGAATAAFMVTGPHFALPASAIAAWQGPPPSEEVRRWALSYALLAPNPHNRQPWIADLSVPDEISLRLDTTRLLPDTDPFSRQIFMGAGAFLELLAQATGQRGRRADIVLFPEGEPGPKPDDRPFARVRLTPDTAAPPDPLFAQVLRRRTDRRPYDPAAAVGAEAASALAAAAAAQPVGFGLAGSGDPRLPEIRRIAKAAFRVEMTSPAPMTESMRLTRVGTRDIDRHRDGISITSPLIFALANSGLMDRNTFPGADSPVITSQIDDFDKVSDSTPAYLWIVTKGNSRAQQIAAGRAYARVTLAGTAHGVAMQPNEQALQEYPEVKSLHQQIHRLLGAPTPDHTVQMLARAGRLPVGVGPVSPAPRRGLHALLTGQQV